MDPTLAVVTSRPTTARRVLLVGSAPALSLLARQLNAMGGPPSAEASGVEPVAELVAEPVAEAVVGAMVLTREPGEAGRDAALTALGPVYPMRADARGLADRCAELGVTELITSFARDERDAATAVRLELGRLGLAERAVPPLWELVGDPTPASLASARSASGTTPTAPAPRTDVTELIGRAARPVDEALIARMIAGKRVLVTGAGGSIGSELTRLCARHGPEEIALIERSENALFEIDRELRDEHPHVARRAVLHDVVDAARTRRLVEQIGPDVVLHAAAHKHVPLMEDHPADAVNNNVFGTVSIADASLLAGVSRFVLISTDKAVHPSSVMGATKRLAELYTRALARGLRPPGLSPRQPAPPTAFASVRFGNVIGSSGSVLTVWAKQLASGGPLTITDPRMTRYFMTIPEAASLVLQAAAMATPDDTGTLSVLDMGEPVSVLDLAERFVRAHGFEPVRDVPRSEREIEIRETGVRPGEKLHEDLVYSTETLAPTSHGAVRTLLGDTDGPSTDEELALMLDRLDRARASADRHAVLAALAEDVPALRAPATAAA